MASSSNRKSNSSASSQKPTFRRSKGGAPSASSLRPAARPKPVARPVVAAQPPKATKSTYTSGAKAGASPKQPKPKRVVPKPTARKPPSSKPAPVRAQAPGGTAPRAERRTASAASDRALAKANARVSAKRAARPASSAKPVLQRSADAAARPRARAASPSPSAVPSDRPAASRASLKGRIGLVVAIAVAVVLAVGIGGVVAVNSSLFAATDIEVKGSEHVSEEDMARLLDVPEGSTLLNVDADALAASLKKNPWVDTVDVEREFPHRLIITPKEYKVAAVVYIAADDIAWAVSESGTWIAPMSLSVTVDADGSVVESAGEGAALPASTDGDSADGADAGTGTDTADGDTADPEAEGAPDADAANAEGTDAVDPDAEATGRLTGVDAALALAREAGALLLIDAGADVSPSSGAEVTSGVVKAGLAYAKGFSKEFLAQVKDLSIPSIEAISANLTSGVEVSLGAPEDIGTKERVVTKLLSERSGVTYINVRTPDAYTFRSADLEA